MTTVQIKDKKFSLAVGEKDIKAIVERVAQKINVDLEGKNPLFLVVLNGAYVFAADLLRNVMIDCEVSFIKLSSDKGMQSSEKVEKLIGLNENIEGRTVVVVEDIIDTGIAMDALLLELRKMNPLDVKIASLLFKPSAFKKNFRIDYIGMEISNDFIVGYGLDYNGHGRNLASIYKVIK